MFQEADLGQDRPDKSSLNGDVQWDAMNSLVYWRNNYMKPHVDDLAFVAMIRDFMSSRLHGRTDLQGVDVGTGSNLYPALSMLPFCSALTLIDWSAANISWLNSELGGDLASWVPFWREFAKRPAYEAAGSVTEAVRGSARIEITQASVFDLPGERWDVGTMFFVAESISGDRDEFRRALAMFVNALRPGAPFAVALMENSQGWRVADSSFPAVAVSVPDVVDSMPFCTQLHQVCRLGAEENPIRHGYTGMILVCGTKRSTGSRPT